MAPTVFRSGPYRFFFYSGDRSEAPHIHVEKDEDTAKFWLEPVRLHHSSGFGRVELNRIQRLIEENRISFLEKWNEHFSD
jgi:hypothetical protein